MEMVEKAEPELLSIPEVARILGVDGTTVRRWCRTGALDSIALPHVGNRMVLRVRRADIVQGLETGTFPRKERTHER